MTDQEKIIEDMEAAWHEARFKRGTSVRDAFAAAFAICAPAVRERCAAEFSAWIERGYRCRTCQTRFLEEHGHEGCAYPNWDKLSGEEVAANFRALPLDGLTGGKGESDPVGEFQRGKGHAAGLKPFPLDPTPSAPAPVTGGKGESEDKVTIDLQDYEALVEIVLAHGRDAAKIQRGPALTAPSAPAPVQNMVSVPREPTQAMWAAFRNADGGVYFHQGYRAMLEIAKDMRAIHEETGGISSSLLARVEAVAATAVQDDNLLCEVAQLIQSVKQDWGQANAWTEWDQSVQVRFSDYRKRLASPSPPKEAAQDMVMREALSKIKAMVCGDKNPRWSADGAVFATRASIADICDRAPSAPAPVYGCAAHWGRKPAELQTEIETALAAASAKEAAPAPVQAGMVMVPREPTPGIMRAIWSNVTVGLANGMESHAIDLYRAICRAAEAEALAAASDKGKSE